MSHDQSGASPVSPSLPRPGQPASSSEEQSPSRGWTHQELLSLIQDDSRHDELDQLLGRLTPEERAKLFEPDRGAVRMVRVWSHCMRLSLSSGACLMRDFVSIISRRLPEACYTG